MNRILIILSLVFLSGYSYSQKIAPRKLVERQGVTYQINSQTPFTGTVVDYHDNGQLKWKWNYRDGKQDGLEESYYDNGQVRSKGTYKDGKKDGFRESYYDSGQLRSKGTYKDGKLDGFKESYYRNGKRRLDKTCYKNGRIVYMSRVPYCEK